MNWEITATGRADNVHETLIDAMQTLVDDRNKAIATYGEHPDNDPANAPEHYTMVELEQMQVATGMATVMIARLGQDDGAVFDVLLRGDSTPGERGFRVSVGEVKPPEPAAATD